MRKDALKGALKPYPCHKSDRLGKLGVKSIRSDATGESLSCGIEVITFKESGPGIGRRTEWEPRHAGVLDGYRCLCLG
jgi:hypothetical protein